MTPLQQDSLEKAAEAWIADRAKSEFNQRWLWRDMRAAYLAGAKWRRTQDYPMSEADREAFETWWSTLHHYPEMPEAIARHTWAVACAKNKAVHDALQTMFLRHAELEAALSDIVGLGGADSHKSLLEMTQIAYETYHIAKRALVADGARHDS